QPSTGHTSPSADTHSPCVRLSSATLEPELQLRRRRRGLHHDARQLKVPKDLRNGLYVRDRRNPTTL
ncbi:MAG: hypothetical protein ACI8X5_003879, partial [Planctomycetota bacterium]